MGANDFQKEVRVYDSVTLIQQEDASGTFTQLFTVQAGRLSMVLHIADITGTLNLNIQHSIDPDANFQDLWDQDYSAVQSISIPLTDFHRFFKVIITITGGNATYVFGGTGSDNSGLSGSAGLVPFEFNDIEITSVNGNGDPTEVVYRNGDTTVATLDITYDLNDNVQRVTRS